jgi:ketosteroid isomerase-like protein
MKRTIVSSICVLIILLFTVSVAFSQSSSEYKKKIELINKEMAKYMLENNTEKILGLYTEDAISMPSYQPLNDGIAAIRKANEEMAKSGVKYNSFETTTLKVMVNGNMITEVGIYKINTLMPGMDKPIDDHGKYLTIWEKQKDGSLKVKIEIWNSDNDPMNMMKQMDQKGMGKKN